MQSFNSYDMRNMLTETRHRHFSERLFYMDSLSAIPDAEACYNGNISAARIAQTDTAYTFLYSYDGQNRLVESRQVMENAQPRRSEWFDYDERGNIKALERYSGPQMMDDLSFHYGADGNVLASITDDGTDIDREDVIEYIDRCQSVSNIPEMQYDANNNLVCDSDREIGTIRYNLLNLPDTIQFTNGNQIVNLYDASGRKYKSIFYTAPPSAVVPQNMVLPYTLNTDTVVYAIIDYVGNIETYHTADTAIQRIFNSTGYYSDSVYYHYVKDHLGNVCVVMDSKADTLIQSTIYYASGVPMAQNLGLGKQPYLYNSKEFVMMHGLNTYDYGFRGYYAPIGRFTTTDPLAESTPWQSPFSYANNNFINAIDWMGLGGLYGVSHGGDILHCIVVDVYGDIIGGANDGDDNIYIDLDGEWDAIEGKGGLIWVSEMEHTYVWYMSRAISALREGSGAYRAVPSSQIATAIGKSLIRDVALGVADNILKDIIGTQIGPKGKLMTNIIGYAQIAESAYKIYETFLSEGKNPQLAYSAAKEVLAMTATLMLNVGAKKAAEKASTFAPKVAATAITIAPYVLTTAVVALAGWSYYKAGEYFINMFWSLDRTLNSPQFWGLYYGYPNNKQNW